MRVGTSPWSVLTLIVTVGLFGHPAVAQTAKPKRPAVAPDVDPVTGLPRDYNPPRDPPEVMLIDKQLLSPEDRVKYKRELGKTFSKRIWNGEIRDEDAIAETRNGLRYYLNELTEPENRRKLSETRARMMNTLANAGKRLEKPDLIREYRRKLFDLLITEVEPMFQFHLSARVQGALVLGELNWIEEDAAKGIKAEAFPPAAKSLIRVMDDPQQAESLKIVCALSLIRILHQGNPNVEQKRDAALVVISQLKNPQAHPWYQTRLAESLGYIDVTLDLNRDPFVFNCLYGLVKDRNRPLRTRTQAAWALGRHPLERGVDIGPMTVDVAALAHELAQQQAENSKDPAWRRSAVVLYLAFKPKDASDLGAKRDREGGLLNEPAAKAAAEEAYAQIKLIVREIIADKPVPQEQIQSLGKWLQANGHKQRPPAVKPASAPASRPGTTDSGTNTSITGP